MKLQALGFDAPIKRSYLNQYTNDVYGMDYSDMTMDQKAQVQFEINQMILNDY